LKNLIAIILLSSVFHCEKSKQIVCNKEIDICFKDCANICEKTIKKYYEFGKCFARCTTPCRKDYCKEARMVEVVDTKDLKSFAKIKRGGSSPSVSIILKRR
tara:strand:+ start:590 stop:895 length:306 start_codon:yes stop_codon:yes gene_type:complete